MADNWISVKIRRQGGNTAYGTAHKIEGSETFGDLVEQIPDINTESISKVIFY